MPTRCAARLIENILSDERETSKMKASKLGVGDVVYKCGVEDQENGSSNIIVSSWYYLGKVTTKRTSKECDVPLVSFRFAECESFRGQQNDPSASVNTVLITSSSQVELSFMSVAELLEDLAFWESRMVPPTKP
ncbi:hypothetical protein [Rhodopirellula europaea]|uniref:hypothetical protein n=1 Tax=Rhodopirellula europaea TaxID=1263866 RepID=UPI0011817D00|nr:hypothetical protein [Rhodopirellula europaea]